MCSNLKNQKDDSTKVLWVSENIESSDIVNEKLSEILDSKNIKIVEMRFVDPAKIIAFAKDNDCAGIIIVSNREETIESFVKVVEEGIQLLCADFVPCGGDAPDFLINSQCGVHGMKLRGFKKL